MGAVEVLKIQAIKKVIVYCKFLENSSKFIADSRQQFDKISPAAQQAIIHVIYASEHLGDNDITEYANLLKKYYWNFEMVQKAGEAENIDPNMRTECQCVKNQKIYDKELIDYYIEYMKRMNLEPICGNFGKQQPQQQMNPFDMNQGQMNNNNQFGGFLQMPNQNPTEQQQWGQPPQQQQWGQPPQQQQWGQPPPQQPQWGQPAPPQQQQWGQPPPQQPQWGQPAPPQPWGGNMMQPVPPQGQVPDYQNNPFAQPPAQSNPFDPAPQYIAPQAQQQPPKVQHQIPAPSNTQTLNPFSTSPYNNKQDIQNLAASKGFQQDIQNVAASKGFQPVNTQPT